MNNRLYIALVLLVAVFLIAAMGFDGKMTGNQIRQLSAVSSGPTAQEIESAGMTSLQLQQLANGGFNYAGMKALVQLAGFIRSNHYTKTESVTATRELLKGCVFSSAIPFDTANTACARFGRSPAFVVYSTQTKLYLNPSCQGTEAMSSVTTELTSVGSNGDKRLQTESTGALCTPQGVNQFSTSQHVWNDKVYCC